VKALLTAAAKLEVNMADFVSVEKGYYGTAVQAASYAGHTSIVGRLLKHGASLRSNGSRYHSALEAAARKGNGIIVKMLLEHGNRVPDQEQEVLALEAAIRGGHKEVAEILSQRILSPSPGGYKLGEREDFVRDVFFRRGWKMV
jgi:hypothetical protein